MYTRAMSRRAGPPQGHLAFHLASQLRLQIMANPGWQVESTRVIPYAREFHERARDGKPASSRKDMLLGLKGLQEMMLPFQQNPAAHFDVRGALATNHGRLLLSTAFVINPPHWGTAGMDLCQLP